MFEIALAAVVVAATVWLGWPAAAVGGALAGVVGPVLSRGRQDPGVLARPARAAVRATLVGWGALLLFAAAGRDAPALVAAIGGLAGIRGPAALGVAAVAALLTLALGAVLAWAAAALAHGLIAAAASSPPERVTLSANAATGSPVAGPPVAGPPERAPAAHTP